MSFVAVAIGGSALVGAVASNSASRRAANAAAAQTQAASEAAEMNYEIGKETLEFNRQYYNEVVKPTADFDLSARRQMMPTVIRDLERNSDFSEQQRQDYLNNYRPVEERARQDAMGYDSQENVDRRMGIAAANVNQQYSNAQQQNSRAMTRMGLNPNSSAFARMNANLINQQALAASGAQTGAAFDTVDKGIALRAGVANFGRNMPNTSAAFGSLANQNAATGSGVGAQGVSSAINAGQFANQGFNLAGNLNYSGGALDLGAARLNSSMAESQARGTGDLFRGIGNAFAMYGMNNRGGGGFDPSMFVSNTAYGNTSYADALAAGTIPLADGGLVGEKADEYQRGLQMRAPSQAPITVSPAMRFADGGTPDGLVSGPGGPRDDLVDARLSRNEFVLNEGAVKHYGLDKLNKMNEVGLQNQARRGLIRSA